MRLQAAIATPGTASLEQASIGGFDALPPAVVLDVDETVLDNSAFEGYLVKTGNAWSAPAWDSWLASSSASAIPGSVEFTKAAQGAGVHVIYITNRRCTTAETCPQKQQTMANLARLGFPNASDPASVILQNERSDWNGDKTARRTAVARNYRIVMMLGDDLGDFMPTDQVVALRSGEDRIKATSESMLGVRWFVLPNPMYGSWEKVFPQDLPSRYGAVSAAALPSSSPSQAAGK